MFNFINKKSIGIDIADRTIEVAELTKKKGKILISSRGRRKIAQGIVERGQIKDKEELSKAVKKALFKAKPYPITNKNIAFGLPESQVYFHIFELDKPGDRDIDKLILEEAKRNIPLANDDLFFSYQELSGSKDRKEYLITAASQKVAQDWQDFFSKLGIELDSFDIETLATFRSVFFKGVKKQVCIIDIGAVTTNISIFNKYGLLYSFSKKLAGNDITKELAKSLKVDEDKAEEQKLKIGLSRKDSRLLPIIIKELGEIISEVRNAIDYVEDKEGEEVSEIILVGGSSQMKGVVRYFRENLKMPVSLGRLSITDVKTPLVYLTAAGYALKGLSKKWRNDPDLRLAPKKEKKRKPVKVATADNESGRSEQMATGTTEIIKDDIDESGDSDKKLRLKKKIFLIIVIVGILLLGGSFWYRSYTKEKQADEIMKIKQELQQIKSTNIVILEKEEEEQPASEVEEETEDSEFIEVIIKDTETGFLNVRQGPSTANPVITQIYPGESYSLLGEESGWVKIELEGGEEGWVSKEYIDIIE